MAARPWNHNLHYYPVVLAAVPAAATRGLDVGCGDGMLARELRRRIPQVTAIDRDGPCLQSARAADGGLGVEYVLGDFLSHGFAPESFDFICSVAALHHMDAAAALRTMSSLLRPGGRLAIIGCARISGIRDVPAELGGIVAHRVHVARRQYAEQVAPIVWPPPETYAGMRRIARDLLPGATFRRLLMWRYSLIWTKPVPGPQMAADQRI